MTKIEILDYVVNHFKTNPRAVIITGEGLLKYKGEYKTKDGHRCGHSICIDDSRVDEVNEFTQKDWCGTASDVIGKFGDEIHKPEFRGHDEYFWKDVQILHDSRQFWQPNEMGGNDLTEAGVDRLDELKKIYKND